MSDDTGDYESPFRSLLTSPEFLIMARTKCPYTARPYPPEADTPGLRRAWDSRMRPFGDLVRDILADADLTWTPQGGSTP